MKRLSLQVVAVAVLVALLAACSSPANGGMTVRLAPDGILGYEVSGGTVTVESRSLVFRNAPGEPQATITGVDATFFASNGVVTEMWISEPTSLSIVVPAGFTCAEPDPVTGCTMLSAGARQDSGQPSLEEDGQVQLLPHTVALEHFNSTLGNATWWGEFTFHGTNAYGPFELTKTFYITAPN